MTDCLDRIPGLMAVNHCMIQEIAWSHVNQILEPDAAVTSSLFGIYHSGCLSLLLFENRQPWNRGDPILYPETKKKCGDTEILSL